MYESLTLEAVKQALLERIPDGLDKREGSYTDTVLAPVAYELWKLYRSLDALLPIAFVDETSGEYIDKRCAEYGIERKAGTNARLAVTFTGADGAVVPIGTPVSTAAGLNFLTLEAGTISDASVTVEAEAEAVGSAYNVPSGAVDRIAVAVSGVEGVTGGTAAGGTDLENDKDLVNRLYDFLQKPAASGNVHHYEQWARETPGVGLARVTPCWAGPGTVKVVVTDQNRGPASEGIVNACAAHIEEMRPIGAEVTVKSAEELTVNVAAAVVLDGTAALEKVQADFAAALGEYVRQSAFVKSELLYNRMVFFLLDIDGVSDYAALTVNNGTANVAVGEDQVQVLGTVVVTQ